MSAPESFIKLSRNIINHWVFQDSEYLHVWIYLICLSQYVKSKSPIKIGKKERYLTRGEFCTSMEKISLTCNIELSKVRTILDTFKENNMIKKTVGRGKNIPYVAKIINYDKWQGIYNLSTIIAQSKNNQGSTYNKEYKGNNGYKEKVKLFTYKCEDCDYTKASEYHDLIQSCPNCKTTLTKGEPIYQESSL